MSYTPIIGLGNSAPVTPKATGYIPIQGLPSTPSATPATPSNSAPSSPTSAPSILSAPQSTPSYFSGKGYSPSSQLDMPGVKSANNAPLGKPLLTVPMKIEKTFMSPETTVPILDSTRVATTFDPTVAQKITPGMLQNGRMPTSVSGTLRDKLGATAFQELDHQMPLELGGSNQTGNLKLESAKNSTIPYNPGSNPTPTDPLENALAEKVHNGDISLVDAWRKMAQAKGITLTEDKALNSPINNFLLNTPDVLEPLANLQTGIQDVFKDIGGHLANIPQDLIDPAINAWKGLDTAVKGAAVTPTKTGAEKVKSILDFVSASANAIFTPITTAFNVLKDVPVVGAVSKMVTLPFQIAGTGGEILSKEALDALPISDTAKNTLKESVGQIGSLAAQIALGYGIGKASALAAMKDTATKVADMKTSGEKVTPKITQDLLKENLDKAKSEIPTENQKTTTSPVKPSETNISPELQPLAQEARKYGYDVKFLDKTPKGYSGKHFSDSKIIEIYTKGRTPEQIKNTLTHEVGHIVDYQRRGIIADPMGDSVRGFDGKMRPAMDSDIYFRTPQLKNEADAIRAEFPKSHSAATTQKEIYADAYRLFKENPERLKEIAPTISSQLTDFYNQATKGEVKTETPTSIEVKPENELDSRVTEVLDELKQSQAGRRELITPEGENAHMIAVRSSFPDWVPSRLRSSDLFKKVINLYESGKEPKPATKEAELYDLIDSQARQKDFNMEDIFGKSQESFHGEINKSSIELTSGLNPHLDKFLEQDINPTLQSIVKGTKKTFDTLKEIFTPTKKSEESVKTSSILRENLGRMARTRELLYTKLLQSRKVFDKYTPEQSVSFIDKIETGKSIEGASDFVKVIRDALDTRWKRIQEIKGSEAYIENYFPHIWKDPEKATETLSKFFGKRPFEGTKSFLKERTIPTIKEGIDLGLEPVSYNPVDLVMAKIADMDKFLMAHDTVDAFKSEGLMNFVKFGDKPPDGWTQINDKIGKVYQYSEEAKGMVARGNYYMPKDGARIINNYLSPGLQGNPIYQVIRKSGNFMTQLNLGLSAFHALFTTNDAVISKIALGMQKISKSDFSGGFKDFAESPTYIFKNMIHGNKLLTDYFRDNPEMPKLVDALERAGGRVNMDSFYKNTATEGFMKALRSENYLGTLVRTPGALIETVAKPILQWLVPRQKLGVFMDMAKDVLSQSEKENWSKSKETLRLQEAWDSVDNRLGEIVYDNLFWNKALKDLGMASVRAVGWNLGTIRELGGGLKDIGSIPYKLITGGEVRMTPRMAYTMTLPVVVGVEGAVLMKLFTGNWPTQLLDYYYPKTGKQNADGSDERIALPSYMKDVFAVAGEGALKVVSNKLNPVFSTLSDMFQNQDYYGTEIRNQNDPLVKQLTDEFTFLAKQFTPFSVQGTIKGQSTLAKYGSFVGLTPAPLYIRQTSTEKKIEGLYTTRFGSGTKTQADAATQNTKSEIRKAYLAGDSTTANKLMNDAIKNGVFANKASANKFISDSDLPASVRLFRRLPTPDQQGLLKNMSLSELNQYAWEASKDTKSSLSSLSDNTKQFVEMVNSGQISQPTWKRGKMTNQ